MSFKIQCECGRVMTVPERREGSRVKCPQCGEKLLVQKKAAVSVPKDPPPKDNAAKSEVAKAREQRPRKRLKKETSQKRERPVADAVQKTAPPKNGPPKKDTAKPTAKSSPSATVPGKKPRSKPPPLPKSKTPPVAPAKKKSQPEVATPKKRPSPEPPRKTKQTLADELEKSPSHEEKKAEPTRPARNNTPPADPAPTDGVRPHRGVEWDKPRREISAYFAAGLLGIACFSMLPAIMDLVEHLRSVDSPGLARWAVLLFFAGTMQIAYALYVFQLRDWGSVCAAASIMLLVATAYAVFVGLFLMVRDQSPVLDALDLTSSIDNRRAAGWCFIMLCLTGLCSYLAGRSGAAWYRVHRALTTTG